MKFILENYNSEDNLYDCLILGFFKNNLNSSYEIENDVLLKKKLKKKIIEEKFVNKIGNILFINSDKSFKYKNIIIVGCGNKKFLSDRKYVKIIKKVFLLIQKHCYIKNVLLYLMKFNIKERDLYWKIRILIKTISEIYYCFNKFKSKKVKNKLVKNIFIKIFNQNEFNIGSQAIYHGKNISLGVKISKDISNMPPNICTPKYFAKKAKSLENKFRKKVHVEIFDSKDIKKLGMNAYYNVGLGSNNKSFMSIIHYNGAKEKNEKPIVLIGKGVTFDTGGICLKNSLDMYEMKYDMSGAASVFGAIFSAIKLNLNLNIIAILACSENIIGNKSFLPGYVIKTFSGKTVEILDTDAEGRLILCDVLSYCKKFNPKIIIDVATLTGDCITSLGNLATGAFSNNNELIYDFNESGKDVMDIIWNLPIFEEYKKYLKSNIADLSNFSKNSAGAITAAVFLSCFVDKRIPWIHLDIAGTATLKVRHGYVSSGRPVDLLSQFLLKNSLIDTIYNNS